MNHFTQACALALLDGWLQSLTAHLSWRGAAWGVGLFLLTFTGSLAVTAWLLVKLPANYFSAARPHDFFAGYSPSRRFVANVGKNLLGGVLFVLGVIMSLPGVPGQGILTILLGLMLTDIPGKRKLEIKIVGRPTVHRTINRIRARYHKPPLELD
ncbi:MAG TPA: hypothetical protein VF546_16530 [Pyrinomonadaceae bacterium]|jgi:hypothetical protein